MGACATLMSPSQSIACTDYGFERPLQIDPYSDDLTPPAAPVVQAVRASGTPEVCDSCYPGAVLTVTMAPAIDETTLPGNMGYIVRVVSGDAQSFVPPDYPVDIHMDSGATEDPTSLALPFHNWTGILSFQAEIIGVDGAGNESEPVLFDVYAPEIVLEYCDTGDPGGPGPADSGTPTGTPDPPGQAPKGCGCATGPAVPSAPWLAASSVFATILRRRRRGPAPPRSSRQWTVDHTW